MTGSIYHCERDREKQDIYDEFTIMVDQCVSAKNKKQFIKVKFSPDYWRDVDDAIGFYEWVISELKQFQCVYPETVQPGLQTT
jgi:hypothetical protein